MTLPTERHLGIVAFGEGPFFMKGRKKKPMKKKVLVLDIDGTLTNSAKIITDRTKEALWNMQASGGIVVIASGRPTKGTRFVSEECRLKEYGGYVLSYNGARIVRYRDGEILYNHPFPKQYLPELFEVTKSHDVGLITYDTQDNVITGTRRDRFMELESRINSLPIIDVADFVGAVTFPISKCLFSGEPDLLAPLTLELQNRYAGVLNVYRSEPFFLEIMPPAVDKAYALSHLIPSLGFTSEDVVCCGDGFNDITMLQYAGVGVAMANAQAAVKEAADEITLSNDEDGLVPVIEKYFM